MTQYNAINIIIHNTQSNLNKLALYIQTLEKDNNIIIQNTINKLHAYNCNITQIINILQTSNTDEIINHLTTLQNTITLIDTTIHNMIEHLYTIPSDTNYTIVYNQLYIIVENFSNITNTIATFVKQHSTNNNKTKNTPITLLAETHTPKQQPKSNEMKNTPMILLAEAHELKQQLKTLSDKQLQLLYDYDNPQHDTSLSISEGDQTQIVNTILINLNMLHKHITPELSNDIESLHTLRDEMITTLSQGDESTSINNFVQTITNQHKLQQPYKSIITNTICDIIISDLYTKTKSCFESIKSMYDIKFILNQQLSITNHDLILQYNSTITLLSVCYNNITLLKTFIQHYKLQNLITKNTTTTERPQNPEIKTDTTNTSETETETIDIIDSMYTKLNTLSTQINPILSKLTTNLDSHINPMTCTEQPDISTITPDITPMNYTSNNNHTTKANDYDTDLSNLPPLSHIQTSPTPITRQLFTIKANTITTEIDGKNIKLQVYATSDHITLSPIQQLQKTIHIPQKIS